MKLLIVVMMVCICVLSSLPVTEALRRSLNNSVKATKELGIYPTATSKKVLTSVDWGVVHPGDVVTRTIYIQNRDRSALTLRLQTGNWLPFEAQDAFVLQWNLEEDHVLLPRTTIPVTLRLIAPSSAIDMTVFQFDIIILTDFAS